MPLDSNTSNRFDTSASHLVNACFNHVEHMAYHHDSNAWSVEGFKQGIEHLRSPTLPSPTSSLGTSHSGDSSKPVLKDVNMQAFVPVLSAVDLSGGDLKPCQASKPSQRDLALETLTTHVEHANADRFQCSRILPTRDVTSVVPNALGLTNGASLTRNPDISTVLCDKAFENDPRLVTTLTYWAAEWLQQLIVYPYDGKGYRFVYRGSPIDVCTALALRITRVVRTLQSPTQVIIHALWYIIVLARDEKYNKQNTSFVEIPIFQHLRAKGTTYAEDFMLRTFVACAMIADKAINDQSFAAKVWARIGRMQDADLASTETFVLRALDWKVHMTAQQWKDMLSMLRSSELSSIDFSPFTAVPSPRRVRIVRTLDTLISLADSMGAHTHQAIYDEDIPAHTVPSWTSQGTPRIYAPQPIRPITQLFEPLEWCPEADPIVNKKPRVIGIAPGAVHHENIQKPVKTAVDLLDSVVGPSANPCADSRPSVATIAPSVGRNADISKSIIARDLLDSIVGPEVDHMVDQKPRVMGIISGTDNRSALKSITARDLLDSILGPTHSTELNPHLWRAGTSFCGPFGAIGQRIAHSVGLGHAWPTSSWFPAQG
ncbi:hypothetical protein ID866_7410 [Astraeus odoratus]|nr:hypothetical protein ID866_7410 [Astraeus odoratus]